MVKNPPANAGDTRDSGSIPGLGRSPGGRLAAHSSIPVGRIPRTDEPGGLQSTWLQSRTMTEAPEHARIHTVRPKTTPFNKLSYINILARVHFM